MSQTSKNPYQQPLYTLCQLNECSNDVIIYIWEKWWNYEQSQNLTEEGMKKALNELVLNLCGFPDGKCLRNPTIFKLMEEYECLPNFNEYAHNNTTKAANYLIYYSCLPEIMTYVMSKGFNPNKPLTTTTDQTTALELAQKYNRTDLVNTMTTYKTIQENTELKEKQEQMQSQIDQMMNFIQEMKLSQQTTNSEPFFQATKRPRFGGCD